MKYAIYWLFYPNTGRVLKYGKIMEGMETEIVETFEHYAVCSSDFHIYKRIIKSMEKDMKRATRLGHDTSALSIIYESLRDEPTAPVAGCAVSCRFAFIELLAQSAILSEMDLHDRKIAATRESKAQDRVRADALTKYGVRPGSLAAATDEERERFRQNALRLGYNPRF